MVEHTNNPPRTTHVHEDRGGNTGLAFVVGILVVVVAAIAWFVFADPGAGTQDAVNITIQADEGAETAIGEAAQAVEGAAEAVDDAAQ